MGKSRNQRRREAKQRVAAESARNSGVVGHNPVDGPDASSTRQPDPQTRVTGATTPAEPSSHHQSTAADNYDRDSAYQSYSGATASSHSDLVDREQPTPRSDHSRLQSPPAINHQSSTLATQDDSQSTTTQIQTTQATSADKVDPVQDLATRRSLASSQQHTFSVILGNVKPKPGNFGQKIQVRTNHFKCDLSKIRIIYQYTTSIQPAHKIHRTASNGKTTSVDPRLTPRKTKRILHELLKNASFDQAATDYAQRVVSLKPLTPENTIALEYTVDLLDEGQNARSQGEATKNWTITLNPLQPLNPQLLISALTSNGPFSAADETINALNLLTGRLPAQSDAFVQVGRDRFFASRPEHPEDLSEGLIAYFGFNRSVRGLQGGMFMQLNASASAFYSTFSPDGTLADLIEAWTPVTNQSRSSSAKRRYQDGPEFDTLERSIRGLKVQVKYTNRSCSVWGFSRARDNEYARPTPDSVKFEWKKDDKTPAKLVSVREYLKTKYSVSSTWEQALVVNVGTADHPVSVPCDLLRVMPGNIYKRLLKGTQTAKMVRFAARGPDVNRQDIENQATAMFGIKPQGPDNLVARYGMTVVQAMQQITSRMLEAPQLTYMTPETGTNGVRRLTYHQEQGDVNVNLKLTAYRPTKGRNWLLDQGRCFVNVTSPAKCGWLELYSSKKALEDQRQAWIDSLYNGLKQYCSDGQYPTLQPIDAEPKKQNLDHSGLRKVLEKAKEAGFDVIFVLLESNDAARYDNLKYLADVEIGIHTICTICKLNWRQGDSRYGKPIHQVKRDADFVANEMLKVNLKMGGINTAVHLRKGLDDDVRNLLLPTTMIVGADVTHPGPASMEGANSIAAVVASYEDSFTQYPASIQCQEGKKEMITNLQVMLTERLDTYARKKKAPNSPRDQPGPLPEQIIFFRDGVGEGDFDNISTEELPQIERTFKREYGQRDLPHPKLLFICVVKRVNTRFYAVSGAGTAGHIDTRTNNILPGLVVDTVITQPRGHDFYMQSQRAIQGTAKPAHYVVIVDEIGVKPDTLQKAIFWQCWTFARSLTPIGVHPAARMADRACARGRSYLREYLVAGNTGQGQVMDRGSNARGAWYQGVAEDLRDTTFHI